MVKTYHPIRTLALTGALVLSALGLGGCSVETWKKGVDKIDAMATGVEEVVDYAEEKEIPQKLFRPVDNVLDATGDALTPDNPRFRHAWDAPNDGPFSGNFAENIRSLAKYGVRGNELSDKQLMEIQRMDYDGNITNSLRMTQSVMNSEPIRERTHNDQCVERVYSVEASMNPFIPEEFTERLDIDTRNELERFHELSGRYKITVADANCDDRASALVIEALDGQTTEDGRHFKVGQDISRAAMDSFSYTPMTTSLSWRTLEGSALAEAQKNDTHDTEMLVAYFANVPSVFHDLGEGPSSLEELMNADASSSKDTGQVASDQDVLDNLPLSWDGTSLRVKDSNIIIDGRRSSYGGPIEGLSDEDVKQRTKTLAGELLAAWTDYVVDGPGAGVDLPEYAALLAGEDNVFTYADLQRVPIVKMETITSDIEDMLEVPSMPDDSQSVDDAAVTTVTQEPTQAAVTTTQDTVAGQVQCGFTYEAVEGVRVQRNDDSDIYTLDTGFELSGEHDLLVRETIVRDHASQEQWHEANVLGFYPDQYLSRSDAEQYMAANASVDIVGGHEVYVVPDELRDTVKQDLMNRGYRFVTFQTCPDTSE